MKDENCNDDCTNSFTCWKCSDVMEFLIAVIIMSIIILLIGVQLLNYVK